MKKLLFPALLAVTSLSAFDTRSHVWIAQQVINDLEDGQVTIAPFGDFTVDPAITSAILDNREVYRMGNIGPDGFPDVIGGQVTVHPGLEDGYIDDETTVLTQGWKSDTWFQWVLSKAQTPQEKAFAYGFLGHGASDTFAHTYVNMYSGDIFDMNDGETDVEKRHIFLEKYISDRLPDLMDGNGNYLGEPYQLVAIDDALPVTFIKETLLMNSDVAEQYALSSTANYLAKMYEFRQKIAALDDDNTETTVDTDLTAATDECDDGFWYPGKYLFSIFSSQDEACSEKGFLSTKVDTLVQIKADYGIETYSFKKAWLAQIDHAIDEYIKTSSRMSQGFMYVNGETYSQLTDWISCYGSSFTDPTTVRAQAIEGSCTISNQIASELSFLNDVQEQVDFTQLSGLKSEVNTLSNSLGNEIISLIGVAAIEIIAVKDQDVSHDSLNEQFSMDQSEKHLLLIADIAERVEAEMLLNNGQLDPERFHVLYNAVVLSKLSLLSRDQINELIARAGVASTYQYPLSQDSGFNLLFNTIKTIDGNHQWMHQAPPYPRLSGFDDTTPHFYGYVNDETHGLKLFESHQLRFQLFNKIFKGPLALGLETPEIINMGSILSSDYPFVSCEANPFPNGVEDQFCSVTTVTTGDNNTTTDPAADAELSYWERFINYLKGLVMAYYYDIIGAENIISTTETNNTVEIITTVPADGITF